MARRKNVKRIDPRYFLDETANRDDDESLKEDRSDHIHGISEKIGRLEAEIERAEDALVEAERLATDPSSEELTLQNLMDLRSSPKWYETQLRIGNMREKIGLLGQQMTQLELGPGGPTGPVGQLARPEQWDN
jgi:hypothetical protein